jgi:PAS domain-containing protein
MDFPEMGAAVEQDASGVIIEWSAAAERLFDWPRADAIDRQRSMPQRKIGFHAHPDR